MTLLHSEPAAPRPRRLSQKAIADSRQDRMGLLGADQVVHADRPSHGGLTQVLVLVLTQAGYGLGKKIK